VSWGWNRPGPSNDAERKTFILVRNRLVALPDGLMFLVPTKLVPTALDAAL
jgi:oxygen-dependent protoporphyrinogen oxidase